MQTKPKTCALDKPDRGPLEKCSRSSITALQLELFNEGVVSRSLLDAVPNPLLIINAQWQVVYANPAVRELVDRNGEKPTTGLSEGEAFHCIHARHNLQEAGKHECCRICSIARVLSLSLKGKATSEDCRLNCEFTGTKANLDLRVWATPLEFHGERFSILSMVDISDKYRREMLENICFHDLLNTLSSIKGFLSIMKDGAFENQDEVCDLLERTTQNSIDEIVAMRMLEQATHDNLEVNNEPLETLSFLELMLKTLQRHKAAEGKILRLAESDCKDFIADPLLLRRVISNMLINALEATPDGGTVTLGCKEEDAALRFWVHNDQLIAREVRNQIFKRTVSNKGYGRGNGTYSIKLLSELLGGEAYFTSTESDGTVFSLLLRMENHLSDA
jgi:nitrogen-specific signal transduction histidine kinase